MQKSNQFVVMDHHPITGFSLWAERIANNKEKNNERTKKRKEVRREQWAVKHSKSN